MAKDFPGALGIYRDVTLADPPIKFELVVRGVKWACHEGFSLSDAFKMSLFHHFSGPYH